MKIYVVQNKKGEYFRNIGYGGYGKSWREKLEDAKFYTKIGQAKSRVTFWFKNYPEFGCPRILAFNLGEDNQEVMEMEAETNKKIRSIKIKEIKRKIDYNERFNFNQHDLLALRTELKRLLEKP